MNTMNTNSALLLLIVLLSLSTSCKTSKSTDEDNSVAQENVVNEKNSNTAMATIYYEKLMSSFNPNWESEEPAPEDYPEYFGGAFIDNYGNFVVCIVGNKDSHLDEISEIIGSDNFTTESCTYSYREMMQVMDLIDDFLSNPSIPEDHIVIQNFAGAMADVMENCVVVNMIEVSDELVEAFKRDISGSSVVFIQQGDLPTFE